MTNQSGRPSSGFTIKEATVAAGERKKGRVVIVAGEQVHLSSTAALTPYQTHNLVPRPCNPSASVVVPLIPQQGPVDLLLHCFLQLITSSVTKNIEVSMYFDDVKAKTLRYDWSVAACRHQTGTQILSVLCPLRAAFASIEHQIRKSTLPKISKIIVYI